MLTTVWGFILWNYGAVFCVTLLFIFRILPTRIRLYIAPKVLDLTRNSSSYFFLLFLLLSVLYLFYPNYFDHFESSVGNFGRLLHQNQSLYPLDGNFPYNGSVYGPVTAEVQYFIQSFNLPIMFATKLPGILGYLLFGLVIKRLSREYIDFRYLIFLFPLGYILFWNRADPWLLLCVSLTLLVGIRKKWQTREFILFGVLGGIASGFKIHGIIYIIGAMLATGVQSAVTFRLIFLFLVSFFSTYSLLFLPKNISIEGAFHYLFLLGGQGQGLSIVLFWHNFITLMFLVTPIGLQLIHNRASTLIPWNLKVFFVCQLLICIVAARPGAGIHHLLPLIPINAYILRRLQSDTKTSEPIFPIIILSIIIVSLVTTYAMVRPVIEGWRTYSNSASELSKMQSRYPGLLMGVTDMANYGFTYQKVILNSPSITQIDYSSFMDMQGSGIRDQEMEQKLNSCTYPLLVMPSKGEPFSLHSYEYGTNLFSQSLVHVFLNNYKKVSTGEFFSIYECSR